MRYLTLDELVFINGTVLNNAQILAGKQKVRDLPLLEAAAARPAASAFGADAYPSLAEKVAALYHSIARNHPFADGNKRTATLAAIFMFEVNGQRVQWRPEVALAVLLGTAEGQRSLEDLAAWWPTQPCPALPEPDADRDAQVIARLVQQHQWLLDELAKR
jgi:death-on-curing protein